MSQPCDRQSPMVTFGTPVFYFEDGVSDSQLRRICWGLKQGGEGV